MSGSAASAPVTKTMSHGWYFSMEVNARSTICRFAISCPFSWRIVPTVSGTLRAGPSTPMVNELGDTWLGQRT
ncbi:MAG: hypothetical protein NTZ32_12375 [Planctomycetales bacterium]|nr:hypothetical protein [Planctomycetales bacterium]